MTAPTPEPAVATRHYPGCEWLCGNGHNTTWRDFECCCTAPSPSRKRGEHGRCTACDAAIPDLITEPR